MKIAILTLMLATASAQTAPKPPSIPLELSYKFAKAHAATSDARLAVDAAQKLVDARNQAEGQIVQELVKTCGEKFQPQIDGNGDPVCVPKPEAKK